MDKMRGLWGGAYIRPMTSLSQAVDELFPHGDFRWDTTGVVVNGRKAENRHYCVAAGDHVIIAWGGGCSVTLIGKHPSVDDEARELEGKETDKGYREQYQEKMRNANKKRWLYGNWNARPGASIRQLLREQFDSARLRSHAKRIVNGRYVNDEYIVKSGDVVKFYASEYHVETTLIVRSPALLGGNTVRDGATIREITSELYGESKWQGAVVKVNGCLVSDESMAVGAGCKLVICNQFTDKLIYRYTVVPDPGVPSVPAKSPVYKYDTMFRRLIRSGATVEDVMSILYRNEKGWQWSQFEIRMVNRETGGKKLAYGPDKLEPGCLLQIDRWVDGDLRNVHEMFIVNARDYVDWPKRTLQEIYSEAQPEEEEEVDDMANGNRSFVYQVETRDEEGNVVKTTDPKGIVAKNAEDVKIRAALELAKTDEGFNPDTQKIIPGLIRLGE